MTISFAEAVDCAGNLLDAAQEKAGFFLADDLKQWNLECEMAGKTVFQLFLSDWPNFDLYPAQMMKDAQIDRLKFDALRLALAYALENGQPYPKVFDEWIASFLRGDLEPPSFGSRRPTKHSLHWLIVHCIDRLVEQGMKPTRAKSSPALTACDAVASALAKRGLQPITYEGIRDIWIKAKRNRIYIEVDPD